MIILKNFSEIEITMPWGEWMNGFIISNKSSKKYGKFFFWNPYLIVEFE